MSNLREKISHPYFLLFSRILLGSIFLVSGLGKLLHPIEEFIVILRTYQLLPGSLVRPFAVIFPWLEVLFGSFLILGLFYKISVNMVGAFLLLLTSVLGITLLRGISIEDCGCFKSFGIKETGGTAFVRNLILILIWINVYLYPDQDLTLDRWLKEKADS